ncbi:hypothetical protein CQA09_28995, partial [Klebsiella pneumoniae]
DAPIRELQEAVDANLQKTAHTKEELNRRINARLTRLKLKGYEGFFAHLAERERLMRRSENCRKQSTLTCRRLPTPRKNSTDASTHV